MRKQPLFRFRHSGFVITVLMTCALTVVGQEKLPDSDPKLIGETTYELPQSAIDAEIDGTVAVAIKIDKTGTPTKAFMTSGPIWPCGKQTPAKALDDVANTIADTMMKLKFSPAIKNGEPVSAEFSLRFRLKNPKLVPKPEIDPATGKPKPRYISGGVLNGKAKHIPPPRYPAEAKVERVSGAVVIQVLVDETGKVARAGVSSGHPLLSGAARDSACNAKFAPTLLSGNPLSVSGTLTYNFQPLRF